MPAPFGAKRGSAQAKRERRPASSARAGRYDPPGQMTQELATRPPEYRRRKERERVVGEGASWEPVGFFGVRRLEPDGSP